MLSTVQEHENKQVNETPYAIAKLWESARIIKQSVTELPILRNRLEENIEVRRKAREIHGDMQNQFRRLLGALNTAALSLLEEEQYEIASHTVKLGQSIKSFNLMTPDYTKLCGVLNNYLSSLPFADPSETNAAGDTVSPGLQTTSSKIIGRSMNSVRMGYYPTCTENLEHVVRGMSFPENVPINFFDPCCGCGIALRYLAQGVADNGSECKTYGIELDGHRAEEALTRINRVGFGSFYRSRISNESFHAMLLNPPYLSVMTEGGVNARSERMFLVDSIKNLMIGGLLIYIIPYYRLTSDVARILCDNFSDISVWKFTSDEFKKFKQIAILGTRQKRCDGSELAPALAARALFPDNLPDLTELPTYHYQLPATVKDVALFKGAEFNVTELAEQLSNSKSLARQFQRSGLDKTIKRPLLPFSIGQIGLVGGSGMINGPVECDTPHILKGRIIKEKRANVEENYNRRGELTLTTITETISNKLVLNILTPTGFISLTDYGSVDSFSDADDEPYYDDSDLSDFDFRSLGEPIVDDEVFSVDDGVPLFPLGQTAITDGAGAILTDDDIKSALQRHQTGDFGMADKKVNNEAIKEGDRILSTYHSSGGEEFWIITEYDRSLTTVLLPEDY